MTCGLDDALSLMVTVPDFAPCVFGEKVTLMGGKLRRSFLGSHAIASDSSFPRMVTQVKGPKRSRIPSPQFIQP